MSTGTPDSHDDIGNEASLLPPNVYLIITNISKHNNIRALLQTAAAFGCAEILVVGQKNFRFDTTPTSSTPAADANVANETAEPSSSTQRSVLTYDVPKSLHECISSGTLRIRRWDKWSDCVSYLRDRNIRLVGVEIHPDARPVEHFFNSNQSSFRGGVAFVMGNEGTGLHNKQIQSCDAFCRIPQYGGGTASLNVYVAASIVLYRFHMHQRQRQQFVSRTVS